MKMEQDIKRMWRFEQYSLTDAIDGDTIEYRLADTIPDAVLSKSF